MKKIFCSLIILLAAAFAPAQNTNLSALLQQGLIEEQANLNLDAAIADYQTLATEFDKDRQIAGTAVFRLGECYRAQGKTNEAAMEYQRILRDFPDQAMLATLSRQNLTGMGMATSQPRFGGSGLSPEAQVIEMERNRLASVTGTTPAGDNPDPQDQEIQRVQTMIQNSPDLINALREGYTPLGNAAAHGWLKVAAFLLDHGADVNGGCGSALHSATSAGNRAMVELLLSRGANVNDNRQDTENTTPLHIAAMNGFQAVMEVLLANKADMNAQTRSGHTPLSEAAQCSQTKILQMLLDAGANPNIADKEGRTPLSFAVGLGSAEMVKALLAAKADPNAGTMDAPLLCAIDNNNLDCAERLLQAGASPNVDGLMHCPQGSYGSKWDNEHSAILRLATPLWLALQKHQLPMVQLLLKYKANPDDLQISEPPPAIFWAIPNPDMLRALLEAGANPNIKSNDGRTPLSVAVGNGSFEAVKLLLKYKADPNDSQTDGRAVIFNALSDPDILKALLDAGANVETREGRTFNGPGMPGSIPIILHGTANPNLNRTPLLLAAVGATNVLAVSELLQYGANPNACDGQDNTALHCAAICLADIQVFTELLAHNANPNVRNRDGKTPLDLLKEGLRTQISDARFPSQDQAGVFYGNFGEVSPEQKTQAEKLIAFLRQHGALDTLPDWNRITISRPSASFSQAVFQKGTNDWNHFSLLELIGEYYICDALSDKARDPLAFADLAHIVVARPSPTGETAKRIEVNLLNAANEVDCSKDVPLEFGDVVEMPEREHTLAAAGKYLPEDQYKTISDYLRSQAGAAQLIVDGGQTTQLALQPFYSQLNQVLHGGIAQGVLTSSSDLSRVKVTRHDAATGKSREWMVDCSGPEASSSPFGPQGPLTFAMRLHAIDAIVNPPNNPQPSADLWLRNGDVIEVPEKP